MQSLLRYPKTLVVIVCLASASSAGHGETIQLWPSDCLTKVMSEATPQDPAKDVSLNGALGEVVSGQVVVRSSADLTAVSCSVTDLKHTELGTTIPAGQIKLQWVRFIDIDRNTNGLPEDQLVVKAPASIPDPFWEDVTIDVKAERAQPLWIEVCVPFEADSGDYVGELAVQADGKSSRLPIKLHVWDFVVPEKRSLSVINWWSFPGVGFRDKVKEFTPEYWKLLGSFCRVLVDHRQTDINTSFGLIREDRNEDGTFRYDTSRLERYAEVAFGTGIRQIHLHSLGRRTAPITDPAGRIEPQESSLRRLEVLEELVRQRGWQDRFLASISDEPFVHHEESYAQVVKLAHEVAPSVRIVEAIEAEYLGDLDIYVPKLSHLNLWHESFERRRAEGAELWFYTCCHPVGLYPNRFLDQSLLSVRVLHWMNYRYDLTGYLHWGLNHFYGDDPYCQAGISHGLPLGDRAIAYPGKDGLLGSLRFSAQRDGLEDYEYLVELEHRLEKIKERMGQEAFWLDPRQRPIEYCKRVVQSLHDFSRDENTMLATRKAIAEEIEMLGHDSCLYVQTSPPEGTAVPNGPRVIIVRGIAPPGAQVLVNGKPAGNVRPSGYFLHTHFMPSNNPTIEVVAKQGDESLSTVRTFKLP